MNSAGGHEFGWHEPHSDRFRVQFDKRVRHEMKRYQTEEHIFYTYRYERVEIEVILIVVLEGGATGGS